MISGNYSASAVKHAFWFMEFRKVVSLRSEGKTWEEIKKLNEEMLENICGGRPDGPLNDITHCDAYDEFLHLTDGKNNPGGNEDIYTRE